MIEPYTWDEINSFFFAGFSAEPSRNATPKYIFCPSCQLRISGIRSIVLMSKNSFLSGLSQPRNLRFNVPFLHFRNNRLRKGMAGCSSVRIHLLWDHPSLSPQAHERFLFEFHLIGLGEGQPQIHISPGQSQPCSEPSMLALMSGK